MCSFLLVLVYCRTGHGWWHCPQVRDGTPACLQDAWRIQECSFIWETISGQLSWQHADVLEGWLVSRNNLLVVDIWRRTWTSVVRHTSN